MILRAGNIIGGLLLLSSRHDLKFRNKFTVNEEKQTEKYRKELQSIPSRKQLSLFENIRFENPISNSRNFEHQRKRLEAGLLARTITSLRRSKGQSD